MLNNLNFQYPAIIINDTAVFYFLNSIITTNISVEFKMHAQEITLLDGILKNANFITIKEDMESGRVINYSDMIVVKKEIIGNPNKNGFFKIKFRKQFKKII